MLVGVWCFECITPIENHTHAMHKRCLSYCCASSSIPHRASGRPRCAGTGALEEAGAGGGHAHTYKVKAAPAGEVRRRNDSDVPRRGADGRPKQPAKKCVRAA